MSRFLCLLMLLCAFATAQIQQKSEQIPLVNLPLNSEPVLTDSGVVASFGPMMCDGAGNIYIRFFTGDDPLLAPITKIGNSGQTSRIEIPKYRAGKTPALVYFAVTPDGEIYEVTRVETIQPERPPQFSTILAIFSRNGTLKNETQFPINFLPSMLVPLQNDEVLVGGAKLEVDNKGSEVRSPLLAVFSSSGQIVRQLSAPMENITASQKQEGLTNPALEFGKAHLGPDGNLYLLFAVSPPKLEVMTELGKTLRTFSLKEPFEGARVHEFFVSARHLLVIFNGPKTEQHGPWAYVLYDNENGEPIRGYQPSFSGVPVCWDGALMRAVVAEKGRTGFLVGTASLP